MAEKEQIRITLKPKGAKIKISLPEEPAEKQQEVMPPSPRDVPKEPAEKIRISLRHDPAPAEPPPMAKIVREEPPPMPRQEKKTEEQLREDAAEAEALLKIRRLEAMAQAEAGNGLERYGLTKRKIIFILFLIGIFVTIFLYAASMEKGAKAIAEAKNPKGRFGKILPQNNELFNELINDEPQQQNSDPPPEQPAKTEAEKVPAIQEPPEETAFKKLRELVKRKAPETEIAAQLRSFQNEFMQLENFHLQIINCLPATPYRAVCRREYLRWAKENPESYLTNLICGAYLLKGARAIPYLERALLAGRNRKLPYQKLIGEYYALGQFSRAAAVCSNYLRIFPDDADAHVKRALIRFDNNESGKEILEDLKRELITDCPALTEAQRMAKLLPYLIHAGDNAEARQALDAVGKVPALQDEWALYEIMYALSNNQEAPPEALKRENVQTAHLRLLYHVSRKEFDAAMHVNAGPDSTIYPDFWDTFATWYCGDDGWKANLMKLNIKFGDDLFRGTMLRLWEGKITLAQAREIMEHVPPHEKGVMAFLLSLAAAREDNGIAKRVLERTSQKSLHLGIYSTLFQRYITP